MIQKYFETKKKDGENKSTGTINPSGCLWAHLPKLKKLKESTGTIPRDAFELENFSNFFAYINTWSSWLSNLSLIQAWGIFKQI